MEQMYYLNSAAINSLALQQMALQQQLIETQQQLIESQKQVISLQRKLDKKTPKNPKDKDVFWHIASHGMMSVEAATSKDLATVRRFEEWNVRFTERHIKPYVSPKVFSECVNQMTRGLPEHIAALEIREEMRVPDNGHVPKVKITPIR